MAKAKGRRVPPLPADGEAGMVIGLRGDVGRFEVILGLADGDKIGSVIASLPLEHAADLARRITMLCGLAESARSREEAGVLMQRLSTDDPHSEGLAVIDEQGGQHGE